MKRKIIWLIVPIFVVLLAMNILAMDKKREVNEIFLDGFEESYETEEILNNNPIDATSTKKYQDIYNTELIHEEQNSCYDAWLYDIEKTKCELLEFLDEPEKEILNQYYKKWKDYTESKLVWEKEQYFDKGAINSTGVLDNRNKEARSFSFNLKRYLYTYTGEIKFYNNGYFE